MGRLPEVIADYSKAIEMAAELNHPQYCFQRGLAQARLEEDDAALADYTVSIGLSREHPGPFHVRGKLGPESSP